MCPITVNIYENTFVIFMDDNMEATLKQLSLIPNFLLQNIPN